MRIVVRNIPLRNVSDTQITVVVEPWGAEYPMPVGESLQIVFCGPSGGDPEVLIADRLISLYGWCGSEAFVLKDNIELAAHTLFETIQLTLQEHESVNEEALANVLNAEELEYVQAQLDSSPAWDSAGREAAVVAVSRVSPMLFTSTDDTGFVWDVCQRVLRSRGIFWSPNADAISRFFRQLEFEPSDLFEELSKWLHDAMPDEIAMAGLTNSN